MKQQTLEFSGKFPRLSILYRIRHGPILFKFSNKFDKSRGRVETGTARNFDKLLLPLKVLETVSIVSIYHF